MVEIVPMVHLYRGDIVKGNDGSVISSKPLEWMKGRHQEEQTALEGPEEAREQGGLG
jgi:hypothetical protein